MTVSHCLITTVTIRRNGRITLRQLNVTYHLWPNIHTLMRTANNMLFCVLLSGALWQIQHFHVCEEMTPKGCCRCNRSRKCKGSACAKAGLTCHSCLPSRVGNCENQISAPSWQGTISSPICFIYMYVDISPDSSMSSVYSSSAPDLLINWQWPPCMHTHCNPNYHIAVRCGTLWQI